MDDLLSARMNALTNATQLLAGKTGQHLSPRNLSHLEHEVLRVAEAFEKWLTWPAPAARLHITAGLVIDQASGQPTGTPTGGTPMQLHDNEQYTISVDPEDSKGFTVTGENLTYTADDTSVVTLVPAGDSLSCLVVAGNPGSAVVTITDGTLSATVAVDVIPGGVAKFAVTEGTPEPQPAA